MPPRDGLFWWLTIANVGSLILAVSILMFELTHRCRDHLDPVQSRRAWHAIAAAILAMAAAGVLRRFGYPWADMAVAVAWTLIAAALTYRMLALRETCQRPTTKE